MMEHVPTDVLSAHLDHETATTEGEWVEAHLRGCEACRLRLADLERAVAAVRGLEAPPVPPSLRAVVRPRLRAVILRPILISRLQPLLTTWRAPAAAAAILVVGLFSVAVWRATTPETPPPPPTARPFGVRATSLGPAFESSAPDVRPVGAPEGVPRIDRAVVRRAGVTVTVADFEEAAGRLIRIAESHGGFVATSSTEREVPPHGTFVLRVPATEFAAALAAVDRLGEVTAREVTGEDVTEEFVDLRARIRNLERQEFRLLTFMQRANRVSDLLAIEQELARVRGEIEQLSGRLRFVEDRISLATIAVEVHEAARQNMPGLWDFTATLRKARVAFLATLRQMLVALDRLIVGLSATAPLGFLGLAALFVLRKGRRRQSLA